MNHVPTTMLRWVRRAFIVYSLHFLVGYLLVAYATGHGTHGYFAYIPLIAAIVVVQMIYEAIASKFYFNRHAWGVTLISFCFALIETFIAAEVTGVYKSPFFPIGMALTFLAGTLGGYVAASVPVILILGFIMGVAGFFNDETNVPLGLAVIGGNIVAALASFLFWRRYYVTQGQEADDKLSGLLHQEQLKSGVIIDSIEDGVVLIDSRKTIQIFNPAAQRISGWKAEDLKGLDYKAVLKLVDAKNAPYSDEQNPFSKVFSSGQSARDNDAVLISHDKKPIPVTISASPLLDNKNRVTGVVGIFRDVSKERSQEQRSADFVSTASHEMRTPVAAIEGYLALALNDRVSTIDTKAREYLEKAHESTQHLGKLFQDLLTSTRAEDNRLSNHPQVVEMSDFVNKVVEDLRFSAEKKGLRMEYVMGSSDSALAANGQTAGSNKMIKPLYYVHADPDRLREVITNLFDNAVKYTETGSVTVGLTGNHEVVQLSVKDTGPGIPAADVPHLFQKFYRVDNTSTRTIGGTGLGLFICRKIVELYHGRIWVESKEGQGSTFFINLPRLSAEEAKAKQNETTAISVVTPLSSTEGS